MYSIFLGPTNQAVPDELWDEFKDRNLINLWDLVFSRYGGDSMTAYRVILRPGFVREGRRPMPITVGHTILKTSLGRSWSAFGSTDFPSVDGFATRVYAAEYMMRAQGYTKKP